MGLSLVGIALKVLLVRGGRAYTKTLGSSNRKTEGEKEKEGVSTPRENEAL
jgi:hypothetical protein